MHTHICTLSFQGNEIYSTAVLIQATVTAFVICLKLILQLRFDNYGMGIICKYTNVKTGMKSICNISQGKCHSQFYSLHAYCLEN